MPKLDYAAIKAAVTMQQVLEHYSLLADLKPNGPRLTGYCPFHHGKGKNTGDGKSNPQQFSVDTEKNLFICHACKKKGSILDFVMAMDGCKLPAAGEKLTSWFGLDGKLDGKLDGERAQTPKRDQVDETETEPPTEASNKPLDFYLDLDAQHPYLTERGLTPPVIAHFGLGAASKGILSGRIAIPIHDHEGNLVAYAGRWPGDDPSEKETKYKFPKGFHKSLVVYNLHRIAPDTKTLILVEGFWSVFWLHWNGYPNVVALMGSTLSAKQTELLAAACKGVLVFMDGDTAGRQAAESVAGKLCRKLWIKVIECPDGSQPDRLVAHELKRRLS